MNRLFSSIFFAGLFVVVVATILFATHTNAPLLYVFAIVLGILVGRIK